MIRRYLSNKTMKNKTKQNNPPPQKKTTKKQNKQTNPEAHSKFGSLTKKLSFERTMAMAKKSTLFLTFESCHYK